MQSFRRLRTPERLLIFLASYATVIGLLVQFSINSSTPQVYLKPYTQVAALIIGLLGCLVISRLSFAWWGRLAPVGVVIGIVALLLVMWFGDDVFGARRWLVVGGVQVQPAELIKLPLAFIGSQLSLLFAKRLKAPALIGCVLAIAIPVILMLLQPDLSTASVIILSVAAQVVSGPIKPRQLLVFVGLFLLIGAVVASGLSGYQSDRVSDFVRLQRDDAQTSYNVAQSRVAIGSGGLNGQGLGGGSQSQLSFLPSQQTDFIFAVVAEKLGFIGAASLLVAEFGICLTGWLVAGRATQPYAALVAVGLVSALTIQVVINIAMTLGLAPVSGLPLPFVSYGGTSLVASWLSIGWLLVISSRAGSSQEA